jgi:hypothetical protein
MSHSTWRRAACLGLALAGLGSILISTSNGAAVFNVKDFWATGLRADDARPGVQRAIEACAAAGGGTVLLPPGEYTSGTLHLRSHLRIQIEAGATLFASPDPKAYHFGRLPSTAALFHGEDLVDVWIGGQGAVDGQAQYEWRADDFEHTFDHKFFMQILGKSLLRPFPNDFPKREIFPHLLWLGRSRQVRVTDLKFLGSPSWTLAFYACEGVVCDRLSIQSSLTEGVWADGIDLDGCKDALISNCRIETGDDCLVFISTDAWGPARTCENITVTNCRLSSASAAVKFSEGNRAGVRNVRILDTVCTNVNRGCVFSTTLGGEITDVLLSNLTIDCNRFDWFWSGDGQPFFFRITRLSEFNHEPRKPSDPPLGAIRNIVIRNITARAKGSSLIQGHPESWLDNIRLENVDLFLSTDPAAPFDKADHALRFRCAKNLQVRNLTVRWAHPPLDQWKSPLYFEQIAGLELESFSGQGPWVDRDAPAVVLNQVSDAVIRRSQALFGTTVFLNVLGRDSHDILLQDNDLRNAAVPYRPGKDVRTDAVRMVEQTFPGRAVHPSWRALGP